MIMLTSRLSNRPCLRCQHTEHRMTTCMWNKPEAWLYDCARASGRDCPTSAARIQSGELVITSCLNRQMELRRVTGNFLSACFGAQSWRVQEWERKITWHRTLAPPLDVFISHSPVTSIWSYSFTFLTGYILPCGLLPSVDFFPPGFLSFLLPLSWRRRSSRVDALLRWLT